MPIVVVQTIARVTMKAAAAANTGRQRAAIHNRTGNSSAIGTTVVQGSGGSAMTITLMTMSDASAARPSMVSFRAGGARLAAASAIRRGAIGMIRSEWDGNHFGRVTKGGAVGLWNKAKPGVPPIPETAVAMIAAPNRPRTWRNRSRLKGELKKRSI